MSGEPVTHPTGEDAERVRQFFDHWQLYQKVAGLNYLHHREAYAALARALDERKSPFRFLDLGAGDAAWTSRVLEGRPVTRYEAVDLSPVALDLARKNFVRCACESVFTVGDFCEVLRTGTAKEDVIYVGLSFHHLPLPDKERMFPIIRERLAEGGCFICYEPVNGPGESRSEVLSRWWRMVLAEWTELTPAELEAVQDHVFGNDYPESCETYARLARQAGFAEMRILYRDPPALYAVMECRV